VINSYKYSNKWTKIGLNVGVLLGNNQDNFHLYRFTTSKKVTKKVLRGGALLTHTVDCRWRTLRTTVLFVRWLVVVQTRTRRHHLRHFLWSSLFTASHSTTEPETHTTEVSWRPLVTWLSLRSTTGLGR